MLLSWHIYVTIIEYSDKFREWKEVSVSPVIRISDATYEKLGAIAVPFRDTPESVIERLLDEYSRVNGKLRSEEEGQAQGGFSSLDPDLPGSLSHTKIRQATFDGEKISRPNWNTLVRFAHKVGLRKLGSYDELRTVATANVVKGEYEDDGFTYLSDADMSIQGLSADSAWESSLNLARSLGVPIEVELEWRNKPEATHPGEKGILAWLPEN